MSAETLRRAAALMRERTKGTTPGPWSTYVTEDRRWNGVLGDSAETHAAWTADDDDADYIASWHPAVALAVARLLDNEAALIECTEAHPDLHMPLNTARVDLLTAVANAYLQEAP